MDASQANMPDPTNGAVTANPEASVDLAGSVDLATLTPEQESAVTAIEDAAKAQAEATSPPVVLSVEERIAKLPIGARLEVEERGFRVALGAGGGYRFGHGQTVAEALADAGY